MDLLDAFLLDEKCDVIVKNGKIKWKLFVIMMLLSNEFDENFAFWKKQRSIDIEKESV